MNRFKRFLLSALMVGMVGGSAFATDPTPADAVGWITGPWFIALPLILAVLVPIMLIHWALRQTKKTALKGI